VTDITVQRSLHLEAPDVHSTAGVGGISYSSNSAPSFIESYRCGAEHAVRRSEDNGHTWTICEAWESRRELGGDRYLSVGLPEFFLDPDDDAFLHQNGCFFATWRADGSGLDWEAGEYVTLPRTHSADG